MRTLRDLEEKTCFNIRRLRYVIDHKIVPGKIPSSKSGFVGSARQLNNRQAVLTVAACHLLRAGIKRDTLRRLLIVKLQRQWNTEDEVTVEASPFVRITIDLAAIREGIGL